MAYFVLAVLASVLGGLGWAVLRTRRTARAAEAAVPKQGRVRNVRGGAIHFVETGPADAPPVVLIHGLGGNLRNFHRLAPLLAGEFRVIALDRPGCGYSTREGDGLAALSDQARMIAELLEAEGVENATVAGHSLGGAVALALALDHPARVGALALLCPLTHYEPEAPEVFKGLEVRSPGLRRVLGATIAVPMAERLTDATLRALFAPEPVPADFLVEGGGMLGMRPQGFVAASADLIGATDSIAGQSARYRDLDTPGGTLFGAEDAILMPSRHGDALAEAAPRIVAETLPGRGHMIPVTDPEACAAFIRRMAGRTAEAA